MMGYSEKAQLAKFKEAFKSTPTKFPKTQEFTFASNSHAASVNAKLSNFSKINGPSLGKGWNAK